MLIAVETEKSKSIKLLLEQHCFKKNLNEIDSRCVGAARPPPLCRRPCISVFLKKLLTKK